MPEPEAFAAMERFRNRVMALDASAAAELVQAYGPIYLELSDRIDALLATIEEGQLTFVQVQRLGRFRTLQAQIVAQIDRFSLVAASRVTEAQAGAVELSRQGARQVVGAALPRGITLETLAQINLGWNALPAEAFNIFVGLAGNGAPLRELLAPLGAEVAAGVTGAIGQGIAIGQGPRRTAALVRDQFGMGLTRSLRISRTETLRSFRESSRLQYSANSNVVKGYRRREARNGDTCMACIALDGRRYELNEPLDEHVNGRGVLIPITVTYRDLGADVDEAPGEELESARTWFRRQPAAAQLRQMGPGKFAAWRDQRFDLEDMATVTSDPVWGDQAVETPLKVLVGG